MSNFGVEIRKITKYIKLFESTRWALEKEFIIGENAHNLLTIINIL